MKSKKAGRKPLHDEAMAVVAIRLPQALVDRLERYTGQLREGRPGFDVTKADAIRSLLIEGLDRHKVE